MKEIGSVQKRSRHLLSGLIGPLLVFGLISAQTTTQPKVLTEAGLIARANQIVEKQSKTWGVQTGQLKVQRTFVGGDGIATIRYRQTIEGIPVANSFLSVTLSEDGRYLSHSSKMSHLKQVPKLKLTKASALNFAKSYFQANYKAQSIDVGLISLAVVDPQLTNFSISKPEIIWLSALSARSHPLTAKLIIFEDDSREILQDKSLAKSFANFPMPYVCDLQKSKPSARFDDFVDSKRIGNLSRKYIGRTSQYPLCEFGDPGRITNSSAPAVNSINETVSYFRNQLGVDIAAEKYLGNIAPYANFGKRLNAKTYCTKNPKSKYCVPTISGHTNVCAYDSYYRDIECPMENAFWVPWTSSECHSGACSAMFFGKGFDKADDVVAHELTHGVSGGDAFLDGLCENCDADSISEAISDYFGEAVDQLNVAKNEKPDANWGMGEDIAGGPFRNMAMVGDIKSCRNTSGWSPVRQIDDLWDSKCDSHTNLGPADRFAWLIANGGIQNGISVSPIGTAPWSAQGKYQLCKKSGSNCTAVVNMTRLAFRTLPYLNGNMSYSEYGLAVQQACQDLQSAKLRPFPLSYCAQVQFALAATGISNLQVSELTRINAFSSASQSISARFGGSNSEPSRNVQMQLQYRSLGSINWQALSTASTDNQGKVSFQVTFPSPGSYRVATVPNDFVGTFSSSVVLMN